MPDEMGSPFFWAALGLLAVLLLAGCLWQSSRDRKAMKRELEEMRDLSTLKQKYDREAAERRNRAEQFRHDYKNLLISVSGLLDMGKTREAQELISQLLHMAKQPGEYPYCPIPAVNAILWEKSRICGEQGMILSVELKIPEDLAVAPVDLCRAFGNLLDNAIHACGNIPGNPPPEIRLQAAVHGDYLIVRCDNPAAQASKLPRRNRGQGLRILKAIAKRYGGSFTTQFYEGVFTACLILLGRPAANFDEKAANFVGARKLPPR